MIKKKVINETLEIESLQEPRKYIEDQDFGFMFFHIRHMRLLE